MINTHKRWLLTASPWRTGSLRLSRLATAGLFFSALLLLNVQAGKAQTGPSRLSKGGTHSTTEAPSTGGPVTSSIPAINGTTTTTCVGSHITLTNSMTGGSWSASNGNVTLTPAGTSVDVLGVTPGTTVVTYTVGVFSIAKTVTVMGPITGPASVCKGNSIALADATPTGIWSSSNTAKATVSVTGVVTGVDTGSVVISYQRISDHATCASTANVTIAASDVTSISPAMPTICVTGVNNTITLTAALSSGTGGTWTSSSAALATVGSTGTGTTALVTAISAGYPTITYTSPTGCTTTKTVYVNGTLPAAISPTSPVVCLGGTTTLTDATSLGSWISGTPSVATINTAGIASGISSGTSVITYTKNACYRTATLTVTTNTISFSGNTPICGTSSITITPSPAGGTWISSNPLVATVGASSGIVTGVTPGSSLLTYSLSGGCNAFITVTVNAAGSAGTLSGPSSVCQLSTITLSSSMPGGTWMSSDATIGSVDAYGHVTGVGAAGGSITVTYSRLGCSTTQGITVNTLPTITGTLGMCNPADTNTLKTSMTLTGTPSGGTWTSNNTAIATVGVSSGVVTSVANGTVNINYTNLLGCMSTRTVTVNGPTAIYADGGNLTACAPLSTGGLGTWVYLHNNISGGSWAKSNSYANTSASSPYYDCTVAGVTPGKLDTIFYTVSGCVTKVIVTVNALPALITGNSSVCVPSTTTLVDTSGGGLGTWSSSNSAIASVSSTGVVTGVAPGGATIYYTLNGCSQNMSMTVGAALSPITSASVSGFNVCASYALDTLVTANPGGTWTASNTNVLVSGGTSTAIIEGRSTGSSVITYTKGGCYTTATVTIIANGTGSISGVPYSCIGTGTTLSSTTSGGVWSVRDPIATAVASSGTTGLITGTSAGTTVVTYTNPANGCFKTFVFNVEPQPAAITGANSVCNGLNDTLTDVTAGGTWSSSNTSIATVSALGTTQGIVKGIDVGIATITYASPGGCFSIYPVAIKATPSSIVFKSKHYGAVCTVPSNPGNIAIIYDSVAGGTWSNSNGLVTFGTTAPYGLDSFQVIAGTTAGTAPVTYTLPDGCFATTTVTVGSVVPSFTDPNNPTPWNYCQGGTVDTLQLGGSYTSGLRAWTVLNKNNMFASNIASISNYSSSFAGGGVQGINAGVATITYTYNGCWATQDITVNPNPSAGISGPSALCTTGLGNTFTLTDGSLTGGNWISNNTAIATVNNNSGLASGVAVGSAIISYAVRYGGCIDVLPVNVTSTVPAAITPATSPTPVCVGAGTPLADATTGGTWSTSNGSVAVIGSTGSGTCDVLGISGGSATVTYSIGGCYVIQPATVNTLPTFTGTGQLCAGNSATLTPSVGGGTWSTRSTSQATITSGGVITATPTGNGDTVSVYYTDANGCVGVGVDTIGAIPTTLTPGSANLCSGSVTTITPAPLSKLGTWSSSNPSVALVAGNFGSGGAYYTTGTATGIAGSGGGAVAVYYTAPGCGSSISTTVNVIDAGTIMGTAAICTAGAAQTTILTDAAAGGTWALSNTNATMVATGSSTTVTGAVAGNDTLTYTVTSGSTTCAATQIVNVMACGPRGNNSGAHTTGVQHYTLFPNPSNGFITIKQSEAIDGDMNLTVMNYVGTTIYNGTLNFTGGQGQINLSGTAPGMYLVMLKDSKGESQTFKIIIEN